MIEKWRAPSIIKKAMSRQLWSATARLTLQPSSFALATPAASILRLASSVSRWLATKSAMAEPLRRQAARARREQLLRRHGLRDDALGQGVADELLDHLAVRRDAVRRRIAVDRHHPPVHLVDLGRLLDLPGFQALDVVALRRGEGLEHIGGEVGGPGGQPR